MSDIDYTDIESIARRLNRIDDNLDDINNSAAEITKSLEEISTSLRKFVRMWGKEYGYEVQ